MLHTAHCTQLTRHLTLQNTVHTVHCMLHTVHCKLFTDHCTLHTAHCPLNTFHYSAKPFPPFPIPTFLSYQIQKLLVRYEKSNKLGINYCKTAIKLEHCFYALAQSTFKCFSNLNSAQS